MSYIGIISEYNPFHNGHKYQLSESLEQSGADGAIALMSGDFTQRGTPAMADKYTRAHAAVLGGLDVVFELPVIYATGSSRDFGDGAVGLMSKMNNVDYLAFGVEDDELGLFYEVSEILATEPDDYKDILNHYLSKGFTFPNASEKAIKKILGNSIGDKLSKPNNILAISYLVAMRKQKSKLRPIIIKRNDGGYSNNKLTGKYSSATAIRHALRNNESIKPYLPKVCVDPYEGFLRKDLPDPEWLSPFIVSRLIYDRNLPPDISNLENVMDMTEELLNRIRKIPLPVRYIELQDYLKTKNMTMSRITRVLLHIVLGILSSDREKAFENGYGEYLNLLALSDNGSKIVKKISDSPSLKVINKKSLYKPSNDFNERLWEIDKLATDLYNQLIYDHLNIRLHSELTSSVRGLKTDKGSK
ncbi:MAG: nucleotidyltransferase family protein [Eubacterium sp.]|nr:nucleotidyltransferase family protein [Eubacterium sp.]